MKIMKPLFLTFALLFATFSASAITCTVGSPTSGTNYYTADPYAASVIKFQRLTGTNDTTIFYEDGTSFTLLASSSCGGWSSIVSGNAKVWSSLDSGNSVTSGLDAGYDAVAFVKTKIKNISAVVATKCATYALAGGTTGGLCTTGYLDWITSRP